MRPLMTPLHRIDDVGVALGADRVAELLGDEGVWQLLRLSEPELGWPPTGVGLSRDRGREL